MLNKEVGKLIQLYREKAHISQEALAETIGLSTSPSLAAAVVMGRNANGRTEWKTISNKSIKDIEEEIT